MRLMKRLATMLTFGGALLIAGCSGVQPQQYAGTKPEFRIEEYFDGRVKAWGIFKGRSGEVRRRFTVDIEGYRDGDEFVLDERFQYADGETDRRVWRIETIDEHTYKGRAGDIIGTATGKRYGNALNWQYTLALETEDGTWNLHFDDWMYQMDDGVLINEATVSKFGFTVGEVTLFFRKQE